MNHVIDSLLKSPLFNLSLSSKELFHSNFIYWIGKNYPEELGEFFAKFCKKIPTDKEIINMRDFASYANGRGKPLIH